MQRQIHQNPEFPFQEVETGRLLRAAHAENGAEVHRIGNTGFVAIFRGRAPIPAGVDPPVIAARGELDAVRGRELADFPWASEKESRHPLTGLVTPLFHGCGREIPGLLFFLGSDPTGAPGTLDQHQPGYWFDHEGPIPTLGVRTIFYTVFARALWLFAETYLWSGSAGLLASLVNRCQCSGFSARLELTPVHERSEKA